MIRGGMAAVWRKYGKGCAHPYEGLPVILAAGVGRSGTTALRHALGEHPDVHTTGTENNILYDVLATALHNCTYPSRRATLQVVEAAYDRQFRMLLLSLLWPYPRRGRRRPKALLASTDLQPDRAGYFRRVFPGGRIAYIVRNGIAVLSSRLSHPNFREVPFEEHCRIWARAMDMARWGSSQEGFVLVKQEDLLDPESARRSFEHVLAGVGLPCHEGCADLVLRHKYHPTAFGHEEDAAAADLAKRAERWQLWTGDQRRTFMELCGDTMRYFGYDIPPVSPHCGDSGSRPSE